MYGSSDMINVGFVCVTTVLCNWNSHPQYDGFLFTSLLLVRPCLDCFRCLYLP
jgi:hypothetical protein